MIIRVVPPTPEPAVLFSVTFPELPDTLALPLAWTTQISALSYDDLEIPRTLHALDKAAAFPTLVKQVTFDLQNLTVCCRFIDHSVEEWPLMSAECVRVLEGVLFDVNESTEAEKELELGMERAREQEKARESDRLTQETMPAPVTSKSRHKRQRSLLMSLVASLVPLSIHSRTSSRPAPSPSPPPPPPTPVIAPSAFSLSPEPRALRRRARSALVDTFRLYVITELKKRMPDGGYHAWIAQSMLRRASARMAYLVGQAGGRVPEVVPSRGAAHGLEIHSLAPPPFYSDDDDASETDDGSSVHTPSSGSFPTPRFVERGGARTPSQHQRAGAGHAAQASYSQSQMLSPEEFAEYTAISAMALRLQSILALAGAQAAHAAAEARQRDAVLEIRARRRAWLNRALGGSARHGGPDGGVGFAACFRSSPLAQCVWTADDLAEAAWDEGEAMRYGESMLFPVSEEDEDDEDESDHGYMSREVELELDLEEGLRWSRSRGDLDRPQAPPRIRTSSMHQHRLGGEVDLDAVSPLRSPLSPGHAALPPSSLLCQPLTRTHDIAPERPPTYSEYDPSGPDVEYGYGGYGDEEFTLAMDVPYSIRLPDQGPGRLEHVKIDLDNDHGWVLPVCAPVVGLDYS